MSRTFGWVQDSASFENLKKILLTMISDSEENRIMRENLIPRFVPERYGRESLIEAITGENCNAIPYMILKGTGISKQLTVEENITMFGYSYEEARRIVANGGRGNAACSGVAQLALPAQKRLPTGENKPYQGDWQAECFLRWGVSLGFIDYDYRTDVCRISEAGLNFALSENGSDEEKDFIGEALMSYPPACRVLKLLANGESLTKFEIGKRLGFVGEAGFTSLPQTFYVGGVCTGVDDIRQNYEGSSDKYARMIAGWLVKIGWVAKIKRNITEIYLGESYTTEMDSYTITIKGLQNLNRIIGGTRHGRSPKRVFWNMLATAATDAEYLRNRRYYIIQAIKRNRTLEEIQQYLAENSIEISIATIIDDLKGLVSIGLDVQNVNNHYKLKDEIIGLEIPERVHVERMEVSVVKEELRDRLENVDHRYLALLDLAYDHKANREFEIETMALMTDELGYQGLHLGGARRPDGLFYKNEKGVIVDTKAYSEGYNLPITQADEMIRYIEENRVRGTINPNCWWENFGENVRDTSFLFVSSEFRGNYQDNIEYIAERTHYDGGVISAKNLLLFAEEVKSNRISYEDSFNYLRENREIVFS